jgi:hypothetical protein
MAVIQDRRSPQAPADGGRVAAATGRGRSRCRSRRLRHRVWALLNAQALLSGTALPLGGVLPAEDDRRRLAARQAG